MGLHTVGLHTVGLHTVGLHTAGAMGRGPSRIYAHNSVWGRRRRMAFWAAARTGTH